MTLLADGSADFEPDDAERPRAAGVMVDERPVAALDGPGDTLRAVVFADGGERPCGVLVPVTLHQRGALAEQLGAALGARGPVAADAIEVDEGFQRVSRPFRRGRRERPVPSVAGAVAADHTAADMIVGGLLAEARGLPPLNAPQPAAA